MFRGCRFRLFVVYPIITFLGVYQIFQIFKVSDDPQAQMWHELKMIGHWLDISETEPFLEQLILRHATLYIQIVSMFFAVFRYLPKKQDFLQLRWLKVSDG